MFLGAIMLRRGLWSFCLLGSVCVFLSAQKLLQLPLAATAGAAESVALLLQPNSLLMILGRLLWVLREKPCRLTAPLRNPLDMKLGQQTR